MKVLALFHNQADPTPYLADEGKRVRELQDAGVLEQLWLRADHSGAVVLLEAADAADARRHLATLPLVQNGIATVDVIELLLPPSG
ncbi:MAG TPA: muconolactone Delta-isomerase family protein [Candidatus Binatia bacterium]|jgi:muconolactone delta-isomerase|nr:muconolactone Delta-isomerase family protein [Candidatus Binatia bacterium]